jgi:hypothetical protein
VQELETGPLQRFQDWPHEPVPKRAAGVYSVWGRRSAAGGMSGQGMQVSIQLTQVTHESQALQKESQIRSINMLQMSIDSAHSPRGKAMAKSDETRRPIRELQYDTQAEELDLKGRGLTALPPEIGQLTNLRVLQLGDNQLRALRHQAWIAASQSRGPVSLPPDAAVQQQP